MGGRPALHQNLLFCFLRLEVCFSKGVRVIVVLLFPVFQIQFGTCRFFFVFLIPSSSFARPFEIRMALPPADRGFRPWPFFPVLIRFKTRSHLYGSIFLDLFHPARISFFFSGPDCSSKPHPPRGYKSVTPSSPAPTPPPIHFSASLLSSALPLAVSNRPGLNLVA